MRRSWSSLVKGPSQRWGSPSGGSTLMTSAPRSASIIAHHGPAMALVRSRILMSASGPPRSARMGATRS